MFATCNYTKKVQKKIIILSIIFFLLSIINVNASRPHRDIQPPLPGPLPGICEIFDIRVPRPHRDIQPIRALPVSSRHSAYEVPRPVSVTFWHAMDGNRGRALAQLVHDFNLTHPSIVIQEKFIGTNQKFANNYNILIRELLLSIKKGDPPVIAQVYENWTTQFIDVGAIIPIEQFINGHDGINPQELDDIFPLFKEVNTYNGQLWTLPFNKSLYVLYYNKIHFKQKHLRPPRTWEEFREVTKKLTVRTKDTKTIKRHGFVFQPNVDLFSILYYSYGGEYFKNEQPAFNGTLGSVILQYLVNMVTHDRSAYPSYQPVLDFIQGKADMFIGTTPLFHTLSQQTSSVFKVGMSQLPRGTEEKPLIAGTNLAIFAKSSPEQQRAAWLFIRWLMTKEQTAEWAIRTGYMPVRAKALTTPSYRLFLARNPEFRPIIQNIYKAKGDPRLEGWEAVRWIITEAVEHTVTGAEPPQTALDEAATKIRILFTSRLLPPRTP